MTATSEMDLKFWIGHVLFMDIVGYSKLVIDKQPELTRKLKEIARNSEQFGLAEPEGTLVKLPTGDGITRVFAYESSEANQQKILIFKQARSILVLFRKRKKPPRW